MQKDRVQECSEELQRLRDRIFTVIPHELGFHEAYFWSERGLEKAGKTKIPDNKLSVDLGRLRLFCIRWSRQTAIFGNGGLKPHDPTGQKTGTSDFPDLDQYMSDIKEVYQRLEDRIDNGTIIVDSDSCRLKGNLTFNRF